MLKPWGFGVILDAFVGLPGSENEPTKGESWVNKLPKIEEK